MLPYGSLSMRMSYYFCGIAALTVFALLLSAWLGISGQTQHHFSVALITSILVIGTHTLLILFMLVTGRVLREAITSRALPPPFLADLNRFFTHNKAYPAAVVGSLSIVAAGVLAYAQHSLGLPAQTHMLAGVAALVVNLITISVEIKAILENQALVDRAASTLNSIDQELRASGNLPPDAPPPGAPEIARTALIISAAAWLPYLYWAMIVWRGDFSKTSLHPWIEISLVALVVSLAARRAALSAANSERPAAS